MIYTIIMNSDKTLTASVVTKIFQREKLVDKIQFLIPQEYNDFDLSEFTAVLKWVDPSNVAHAETLELDEELYKERLRYTLPVDTSLTKMSGDITLRLTFSKLDTDTLTQYVMHTGEIVITISALEDYYKFVTDDSLEIIDNKISSLDAKIGALELLAESYENEKADNLSYSDGKLQLMANDSLIGDEVDLNAEEEDSQEVTVVTF